MKVAMAGGGQQVIIQFQIATKDFTYVKNNMERKT